MTALEDYKTAASEINALSERIDALYKLRTASVKSISPALNLVLKENGLLRNIMWVYKSIDQNHIIFEARHDNSLEALLEFLGIKERPTHADYDLKRTEDNDHVIVTLSITPTRVELYIDRDYVLSVVNEYRLTKIFTGIINAHIEASYDLAETLSNIILAVEQARYAQETTNEA